MRTIIHTKQGRVLIDTDKGDVKYKNEYILLHEDKSPVFEAVRKYFDDWINYQSFDISNQYLGRFEELDGNPYLEINAAIRQGVDALMEYLEEGSIAYFNIDDLYKVDLEGVFQP